MITRPPIALQLYLLEPLANDREWQRKAAVLESIAFQTKPLIALDQIKGSIRIPMIDTGTVQPDLDAFARADLPASTAVQKTGQKRRLPVSSWR